MQKDDVIHRQDAFDALDEQIEGCNKALSSFNISIKDEFAVKVERASLVAFRDVLEYLPSAKPVATDANVGDKISRQAAIDAIHCDITVTGKQNAELVASTIGAFVDRIKALPSAQPEQRWIPCSEQLPRQGQEVICQCRANIIKVLKLNACGDWYQDAEHCYMGGFVIAWMPLPGLHKEGETT